MSEVKPVHRYKAQTMFSFGGAKIEYFPRGPDVVMASEYDAQRLRADTAERALANCNLALKAQTFNFETQKAKVAAAEQRIAELRELLRLMTVEYACCLEAGHDRITFLGGDCDSVSKMLDDNVNYAKACAALNQKTEGESHE